MFIKRKNDRKILQGDENDKKIIPMTLVQVPDT